MNIIIFLFFITVFYFKKQHPLTFRNLANSVKYWRSPTFQNIILEYSFFVSNPQSCLYFRNFQGSKSFNGCLVVWSNKQIFSDFQSFFNIRHWHTILKFLAATCLHKYSAKIFGKSWILYSCLLKIVQPCNLLNKLCTEDKLVTYKPVAY